MKKRGPIYGQNGQLVHWWVLVHSGPAQCSQQMTACFAQENVYQSLPE
jgi:hypothetical protein